MEYQFPLPSNRSIQEQQTDELEFLREKRQLAQISVGILHTFHRESRSQGCAGRLASANETHFIKEAYTQNEYSDSFPASSFGRVIDYYIFYRRSIFM